MAATSMVHVRVDEHLKTQATQTLAAMGLSVSDALKKAPSDKRAVLPRASDRTKTFAKDWTRLTHSGRFDMKRLKAVMSMLVANDAPLGPEWLDHALVGDWADHRECHIGGDFLLIYQLQGGGANEQLIFVRVGTHADLFE